MDILHLHSCRHSTTLYGTIENKCLHKYNPTQLTKFNFNKNIPTAKGEIGMRCEKRTIFEESLLMIAYAKPVKK